MQFANSSQRVGAHFLACAVPRSLAVGRGAPPLSQRVFGCVAPSAGISLCSTAAAVLVSSRHFSSPTRVQWQARPAEANSVSAMDVAIEVNKLKKTHQSSAGPVKKEVEKEAWQTLQNGLTEEAINSAEGKAVALLLNSWAYFSKYWEKGKDGPILPTEDTTPNGASAPKTE